MSLETKYKGVIAGSRKSLNRLRVKPAMTAWGNVKEVASRRLATSFTSKRSTSFRRKPESICFIVLFSICLCGNLSAQQKFWVFFKDKSGAVFNPYQYFNNAAIQRRQNANLPLCDSTDFSLNQNYVIAVSAIADSIHLQSRWLNAISVWATEEEISKINSMPFVRSTSIMGGSAVECKLKEREITLDKEDSFLLDYQIKSMHGEMFAKQNISGKGIKIAILDNGFSHSDIHPAFSDLMKRKGILKMRNFNTNDSSVYSSKDAHGTMVLSCIAGKYKDKEMGLAPDADFLLAIVGRNYGSVNTNDDNWVAALEWADKEGAQIVNSSLEYVYPDYIDMVHNNEISIETYTANLAAKKGMLVVVAAGNEGATDIKYIGPPADADSVLTVGAVKPETGTHVPTSSFGPNYHWQVKPNLTASGHDMVALANGKYQGELGTSFAAPLVTGFAACVWQMHPSWTNMQLSDSLEKSGSLYPYYDYANGYGISQAGYFLRKKDSIEKPTFSVEMDAKGKVEIILHSFDKKDKAHGKLLYYHIADAAGTIRQYYVVKPKKKKAATLTLTPEMKGAYLVVFFDGFTEKVKL